MSEQTPTASIGDLVTAKPGRSRVFEKFGVDYCCRGSQTLEAACAADGKDLAAILGALPYGARLQVHQGLYSGWRHQLEGALVRQGQRAQ